MVVPRFRYELAPARKDRYVLSVVLHILGFLFLWKVAPLIPGPQVAQTPYKVELLYTRPLELKPPAIVQKPLPPPIVAPARKILVTLTPPKPMAVRPEPKVEPPRIESQPKLEIARAPAPERPKLEPRVVTGKFVTPEVAKPAEPRKEAVAAAFSGSSQPATLNKAAREVQTGGFGDPNGVRGTSERKGPLTAAALGSFELPGGPGSGNGIAGSRGTPGTLASSGFGDVAGGGNGNRQRQGTVVQAGFNQFAVTAAVPKAHAEGQSNFKPVEILYKPRPAYTAEARQLRVQGEVLVEVMFTAAGQLEVRRVVKGLGHGLDESALRAAQQIRFRPAQRDGTPYDSAALVHIVFELAE